MPKTGEDDTVQETLQRWHEEAELAKAKCRAPGVATREELIGRSGMDFFADMMSGKLPPPHMAESGEFVILTFSYGHVVMQGATAAKFQNTLGIMHGGWIATILDSAVGCAVHTTLPAGMGYATAELKVSFLRPLNVSVGLVRAEGKIISAGKKIVFAEGTLFGPDGKKYAHATTTCAIFAGVA